MKIHTPHEARERMLVYGGPGAGKTYGYFKCAQASGGNLYIIESDPTVMEYVESDEFSDMSDRVHAIPVVTFPDYQQAMDDVLADMGRDDWLAVDMAGKAWSAAQDYFSEYVFGKSGSDLFLEKRKEAFQTDSKKGNPFDGLMDWPAIKKLYFDGFAHKLLRVPGHLYLVSAAKDIIDGLSNDQNIVRTYGNIGARPDGEKSLGYPVRTVLYLQGNSPKTWRMTKVKDRQRDDRWGEESTRRLQNGMHMDYLVKIAGWRPGEGS